MTLKGTSPEGQARAVRERYREKERKVKEGPNSEDIWRRRKPEERIERPFGVGEEQVER